MKNEHAIRELQVFNLFACAAGLPKGCAQKRQPPEPDVLFCDSQGSPRAFELVELIDQDYRHGLGRFIDTKNALITYYESLPSEGKSLFDLKYGDALLYFRFRSRAFSIYSGSYPAAMK